MVKLSTGEEVHISDRYTRKAQKAYNLALGVVYTETEAGGLEISKQIPMENFNLAAEAALLCLIEKVVQGSSEQSPTQDWIDRLETTDFEKLSAALMEIKTPSKDKKK